MGLAGTIKALIPMRLLFLMKYCRQFCNQKQPDTAKTSPAIYYLDAPSYGNLGDQAIALAIRSYCSEVFPDYDFVEILQDELPQYVRALKKNIKPTDLIVLTGGGNMGDTYRIYEAARRFVIRHFPHTPIVVFPQTIEYTKGFPGRQSQKQAGRIYGRHKNLIVCAREQVSYEKMQAVYPKNRCVLCPDIVLSLPRLSADTNRTSVGICLREDREAKLTVQQRREIIEQFPQSVALTTSAEETPITEKNRRQLVMDRIEAFSKCALVITDRLHAMIFSYLAKTPCVVLENSNHKVAGVYRWLENIPSICLAHTPEEVSEAAERLLSVPADAELDKEEFAELTCAIRGIFSGGDKTVF